MRLLAGGLAAVVTMGVNRCSRPGEGVALSEQPSMTSLPRVWVMQVEWAVQTLTLERMLDALHGEFI